VASLVSSSSADPWACDWWYLRPLICLYFLEQLGSGHSSNTGEVGGGLLGADAGPLLFFDTGVGVVSLSFDFLLLESVLGGANGVGELDPVELFPELLEAGVLPLPPRPLLAPPPFLSLLCTDDLVSVKLLKSPVEFVLFEARPRFPRPFGVLESKSLVGESQKRGGAQSCRVQSNNVPT
jgi:hypothetical protein